MIVKELIEILKKANPNDLVVMASDPEGNSYSGDVTVYTENNAFCDESLYLITLTDEMKEEDYTEEDVKSVEEGGIPCIVFYP